MEDEDLFAGQSGAQGDLVGTETGDAVLADVDEARVLEQLCGFGGAGLGECGGLDDFLEQALRSWRELGELLPRLFLGLGRGEDQEEVVGHGSG